MKRFISAILPVALILSIASCVNEEYDLDKIEVDSISGLEGISFPFGSSRVIKLDEFVDLGEENDVLKTDDAGNFYFSISDPEIFTREFSVPVFNFDGFSEKNPHDFTIGTPVTIPSLSVEFESPVIPFSDVVYDVEVDQRNLPDAIGDIYYAEVTSEMTVAFSYDQSTMPLKGVTLAKGSSVTFPEWVVLGDLPKEFTRTSDYKAELASDYRVTPSGTIMSFPLAAIDFAKIPENQGVIGQGHLYLDAEIRLSGGIILKSSDCISAGVYKPVVSTFLEVKPISIRNLRLSKVNFGKEASESQIVQLKGILPDFIYDEGFTCDLNNLSLKVNHYNGLPFSGYVAASVDTYENGGVSPLRHYDFGFDIDYQLNINDDMVYHHFTESGKDGSIRIDGFNALLNPVPDYLDITTDIRLDDLDDALAENKDFGLIIPGSNYSFKGGYELIAPLSFGKDFSLSLTHEINDLDLQMTNVDLAEVEIKFNLINALPFEFSMDAQAIDAEGNVLPHINVALEGDVKGGTLDAPAVNPVVITLTNSGELSLDGIRVTMAAAGANEENVLNKNQYMQFTDISIRLPKGITYHIGENK